MERRQDDVRIEVLSERIEHVLSNQEKYSKEATEWRGNFCRKLDKVIERLDSRPCVEHGEKLKMVGTIGNSLWGLILVIIPLGLAGAFYIITLVNDVNHIKETSYGYRGIKVVEDGKRN